MQNGACHRACTFRDAAVIDASSFYVSFYKYFRKSFQFETCLEMYNYRYPNENFRPNKQAILHIKGAYIIKIHPALYNMRELISFSVIYTFYFCAQWRS